MNTDGYTKLLSRIVTSSVWVEPHTTLRVWIMLLALANRHGIVRGSPVGMTSMARVTREEFDAAMHVFLSPDPESTNKDYEGRRLECIPGGWLLLNFPKIRDEVSDESRREYKRNWIANKRRQLSSSVDTKEDLSINVTQAEAEAEAEAIPLAVARGGAGGSGKPKTKMATKNCPDTWQPSSRLLQRIADAEIPPLLEKAGTSVEMELERMRSCTFKTGRSDWDKVAWHWLLTECKNFNQKENLYESHKAQSAYRR